MTFARPCAHSLAGFSGSMLYFSCVFMWFAGAHPGYGAPELLKLAEAPAPDSVTNETIFRWVCQQRAAFYQAPENEEAYRKQYRRAIAEEAPAPAP